MLRVPRMPRGAWTKLLYLSVFALGFMFLSSQFKNTQSAAKAVMPKRINIELRPANAAPPEDYDHDQVKLQPARPGEHVPLIKNEEGDGVDADRVDIPDVVHQAGRVDAMYHADQPVENAGVVKRPSKPIYINSEPYPKLNNDGKFIPQRRIIHLDLKGAPYKPAFFSELFNFFSRLKATGVLIEWEDMFPFTGRLAQAINGNAYKMEDIEFILSEAKRHNLEVIPLVQTFGHLEWILKLEQFAHLREDSRFPQVICFPMEEAWELLTDMVDQVAAVHQKHEMSFFHIGADEAFQIGICNASRAQMSKEGSRDRLMLWHIARMARYVKEKYSTTVLAWHDMFANAMDYDLRSYRLTEVLEPVLWSYAEQLDMYLPRSTWRVLEPFGRVWGSSAYKGADGPARYNSNPIHYIRNHESWIEQFTSVYKDFDVVQGLIMTGWSRYDHLAVLAELLPVAIPNMALSMETMLEGRVMSENYPLTDTLLQCNAPTHMGFTYGCSFPGSRIYELVNDYWQRAKMLRKYRQEDYELNGWLSRVADRYAVSSHWYIDKIEPLIESHAEPMLRIEKELRVELNKIYFEDVADEWIFTFMGEDLEWLAQKQTAAAQISKLKTFPKRPFIEPYRRTEL